MSCVSLLLFLFLYLFSFASSLSPLPLPLNTSIQGNTTDAPQALFLNFTSIDSTSPPIGYGGQRLFLLNITAAFYDVEISTCHGTDFPTYLAVLNTNPLISAPSIVLSESGNDLLCPLGPSKAYLQVRLSLGIYYVILTGHSTLQGNFNVTTLATIPTPTPVPWHLDRLDQRHLPLNRLYSVKPVTSSAIHIYLLDSGVRVSHSELRNRVIAGFDFVNMRLHSAPDCTGHGTHVAGLITGEHFGVAKHSNIIAVRIFDCNNTASLSILIDSLQWVLADSRAHAYENAIIALSFDLPSVSSSILPKLLHQLNLPIIIPGGNQFKSYCESIFPSFPTVLSIGATTSTDAVSAFSNHGNCVSLFAPGSEIRSCWHTSETATREVSGSAQSAGLVAGIVGVLLDLNPGLAATKTKTMLESLSTKDVVHDIPSNYSSRLAYVRTVPGYTGTAPPSGRVYLFCILTVRSSSPCTSILSSLSSHLGTVLSVGTSSISLLCVETASRSSFDVSLRVETLERTSGSTFSLLSSLSSSSSSFAVSLRELPWAVDASGTTFWGAPSFSGSGRSGWTGGRTAGVTIGAVCGGLILLSIGLVIYRRVRRLDEIGCMEGSGDLDKGPVMFNEQTPQTGQFRHMARALSFRKSRSMRDADGARGMNRMGSYIGGAMNRDAVRLESFGGEAFAGMTSMSSRSASMLSCASLTSAEDTRAGDEGRSFRAAGDVVQRRARDIDHARDDGADSGNEEMRMQSRGGEAFALMLQ